MDHRFEFTVRPDEQVDVMYGVTARALKVKRQRFNWRVFFGGLALVLIALFLVDYWSEVADWTYEFTAGVRLGAWSVMMLGSVGWLVYCRLVKRKLQRAVTDGAQIVVRFDDHGIVSESDGMSVRCPWASVRQVLDSKDRLELDLGLYSAYVPLRGFDDRDHFKRVVDEVRKVVEAAKSLQRAPQP